MEYGFCHVSYQKGSVGYTATIKQIKNNLIPSWTLIDRIAAVFHKIADDGFVPRLRDEVLGHEFMGIIEEVGPDVTWVKKGDR